MANMTTKSKSLLCPAVSKNGSPLFGANDYFKKKVQPHQPFLGERYSATDEYSCVCAHDGVQCRGASAFWTLHWRMFHAPATWGCPSILSSNRPLAPKMPNFSHKSCKQNPFFILCMSLWIANPPHSPLSTKWNNNPKNSNTHPKKKKTPPTCPVSSLQKNPLKPQFQRPLSERPWGCEDFEVLQRFAGSPWQFQEPHFPQEAAGWPLTKLAFSKNMDQESWMLEMKQ